MEQVSIIGVDLANKVFHLPGATAYGAVLFNKKLSCLQFGRFMADHRAGELKFEASRSLRQEQENSEPDKSMPCR